MLILTNDQAGRTGEDAVAAVEAELSAAGPTERAACRSESEIEAVLDRRGDRPVVVVGGDGSLHTLLGLLWRRGEADRCPVAVVPLGTGNDFARSIGMPLEPRAAAGAIARALRAGGTRPADLIVDDAGGVVVNAVHLGAGAEAAVLARPLKRFLRAGSFPVGAVVAGVRARGWRLRVTVDGTTVAPGDRPVLMVGVSNGRTIAGGNGVLAPDASPFDGRFEVTVSGALAPVARMRYAVRLMRGTHHGHRDVMYRTGRTVTVSGEPFHVNADGEVAGPCTGRTWTIRPGAWRCVLPMGADQRDLPR